MGILYGRAGRLTAQNAGFRPGQFLPNVVHIVAMLVIHRGSDAISICFNALAVLFLLGDTAPAGGGRSTPSVFDSGLILEKFSVLCNLAFGP
jgi:hypothetical protein